MTSLKPEPRLSWDDLQVFLLVAETGSANRAADHLQISHTTVGRRVKELEDRLGVRLVERTTGTNLQLTIEGAIAAEEVRRMNEIASTLRRRLDGQDSKLSGNVRVTITEGIASFWLAGALQQFIAAHPELHIDWITSNISRADLHRDADIGVLWFRPEDPHLISRRLGTINYSLFTSQAYIDAYGLPSSVEELADHPILHFHGYDVHPGFRNWSALMRRFPPAMTLESTLTAETVMRNGNFIALLPDYATRVAPEVVRVPLELGIAMDVWIGYHEDRRNQARVRALSAEIIRLADAAGCLVRERVSG